MSLLSLREVTYRYPSAERPALDGVSVDIEPGELVVVAGESGSGKSTLLRVAAGLAPHFYGGYFAGRALVAGRDTRESRPGELADAVGSLFQDPESQVVMGSVRSELAFGLENLGHERPAVARGVEEAALALGVAHLLDRPTAELSGGELQRVALAAAVAPRPDLLLLDEPTSQLDPVAGDELIGTLRRLNEDGEVAIVLAEHRLERCLGLADRVLALAGGRVVCDASPAEFLEWALDAAPALATPGARLLRGLGLPARPGVKAARAALAGVGLDFGRCPPLGGRSDAGERTRRPSLPRRRRESSSALAFDGVWHELRGGRAVLRALSLSVAPGERVAIMGRNGAGKSTLLRCAGGLTRPTRGRLSAAGRVALLLQNPTDYLVADAVGAEAPAGALRAAGLDPDRFAARHPRDLSGGERQRLALAIVLGDGDPPAVACLDEPTRGMDRARKNELATLLRSLGAATLVATHDPEFAAAFADRVLLLGDGELIADGPSGEILAGGAYFATETARILRGAGGALLPEAGIAVARAAAGHPIEAPA